MGGATGSRTDSSQSVAGGGVVRLRHGAAYGVTALLIPAAFAASIRLRLLQGGVTALIEGLDEISIFA